MTRWWRDLLCVTGYLGACCGAAVDGLLGLTGSSAHGSAYGVLPGVALGLFAGLTCGALLAGVLGATRRRPPTDGPPRRWLLVGIVPAGLACAALGGAVTGGAIGLATYAPTAAFAVAEGALLGGLLGLLPALVLAPGVLAVLAVGEGSARVRPA